MYTADSQNKPKQSLFPWIIIAAIFFSIGSCSLITYMSVDRAFSFFEHFDSNESIFENVGNKDKMIAELDINGVIMGSRKDIFDSLEDIETGVKKDYFKALIIAINSPGGSVAPTQDIYRRILELRKKIPVICTMGDVAASGGYYLAAACEEIYVLPGTTTGSIGVIFQFFNFENLVSWAKLKPVTIKAGKFKDIGSPFREMKVEELAYLQDLLNQVHEQFIKDILSQRSAKIKENVLREQADGRIFTGEQAIKLGFADKVGGFNEALKNLRETKNLGDLEVRRFPKPRRKIDSLLAQMDGKSNFSEQLKSLGIDHLHPFQGMAPMLLPSYLLQAGR